MFPNAMNQNQMNPGMRPMVPPGVGNSALLGASYQPNPMMQGVPNMPFPPQMAGMNMNPMIGNNATPFVPGVNTQNRQYGNPNFPNNGQYGNMSPMTQQPWGYQGNMPTNDPSYGQNIQSRNNREPGGRAPSIITSRRDSSPAAIMPSDHEIGTAISILKRAEKCGKAKLSQRQKEVSFNDEVTIHNGNQNYPPQQMNTWNQGNPQQNVPNTTSRQNYYVY